VGHALEVGDEKNQSRNAVAPRKASASVGDTQSISSINAAPAFMKEFFFLSSAVCLRNEAIQSLLYRTTLRRPGHS
jgi:hypothetical protein